MASLFGPPKVERHRTLRAEIQQAILVLKAEHPAFGLRELRLRHDPILEW